MREDLNFSARIVLVYGTIVSFIMEVQGYLTDLILPPPRPPPTGALLPDSNSILHFKAENTETPPNQLWSLNLSLRRKRQKNALPT